MIFLKKILDDTKTRAEPNAHSNPVAFDAETSKLQASMTPNVRGNSDRYVCALYDTPKTSAYAATVNSGESALIVCTVLTGMRAIAILENMCPPTWKQPIGKVSLMIALVGIRNLLKRTTGLIKTRQNTATKPNCTKVRVTGYRN